MQLLKCIVGKASSQHQEFRPVDEGGINNCAIDCRVQSIRRKSCCRIGDLSARHCRGSVTFFNTITYKDSLTNNVIDLERLLIYVRNHVRTGLPPAIRVVHSGIDCFTYRWDGVDYCAGRANPCTRTMRSIFLFRNNIISGSRSLILGGRSEVLSGRNLGVSLSGRGSHETQLLIQPPNLIGGIAMRI